MFQVDHLVGKIGDLGNLLPKDLQLPLPFLQLQVYHPDFLFLLPNLLLSMLQPILLNIRLLIQNTQLVITINKLNTHVIPRFTGLFILIYQVVHLSLQRIDDQVQFITLINLLPNVTLFFLEL